MSEAYATLKFSLAWKSAVANHQDSFVIEDVDLSKDLIPLELAHQLKELNDGETYQQSCSAKDLLGQGFSNDKVLTFDSALFDTQYKGRHSPAILNRFYPSAIAWQGVDTEENDKTPFRLISINKNELVGDKNHPLAKYYLKVSVTKLNQTKSPTDGETLPKKNIARMITLGGPGMQVPFEFNDSVFFTQYPFNTSEIENEQTVYPKTKISEETRKIIASIYASQLKEFSKVLDLCCGNDSFLSNNHQTGMLTGFGSNEQALLKNIRLDTYQIQNINENCSLPFKTDQFDDAICSLSIDSLVDPLSIMQEISRVVASKGKFIITFSNHRPSEHSISLWSQLHPFERVQLVLEYFHESQLFEDIHTFSERLIPSNHSASKKHTSPTVFAVWGSVK